jgi:hypothetical protein
VWIGRARSTRRARSSSSRFIRPRRRAIRKALAISSAQCLGTTA